RCLDRLECQIVSQGFPREALHGRDALPLEMSHRPMQELPALNAECPTGWSTFARTIGALAIVLISQQASFAQDTGTLQLTLEEAQARAIDTSHRLAEGRARETAAQAVVDSRQAADRPIVSVAAGYTRTNHVLPFGVPSSVGIPTVLYPDVPDNYR